MTRTALVTGASAGIGEAIAVRLAAEGFRVYAAARRLDRMEHLKAKGIRVLPLDVTDEASIKAAVAAIEAESDGIDVLVNNAGYGSYGAVEDVPLEEARRQFEVNVFGLAALIRLAAPHMRRQRWGRVINITSIGGVRAFPFGGWYHATKFAVEGLSSSLRQELRPFGVDVVLIRPGAIKSEWAGIALENFRKTSGNGAYASMIKLAEEIFASERVERMAGEPSAIADVVARAATARRPHASYTAPRAARIMLRVLSLLGSDRCRDAVVRRMFRMPARL
ncbi:MAG: short-chain dehydrogenase [Proteobacteria bacterium]|nr:short-chain dehydrogenase [Pseudomonadota bacterium]